VHHRGKTWIMLGLGFLLSADFLDHLLARLLPRPRGLLERSSLRLFLANASRALGLVACHFGRRRNHVG
jgi:hypothetical protein